MPFVCQECMANRTVSFVRVDADDFDPDAGFAKKGDQWDDEDQDLKLAVGVSKWVRSLFWLPLTHARLVFAGTKGAGGGKKRSTKRYGPHHP